MSGCQERTEWGSGIPGCIADDPASLPQVSEHPIFSPNGTGFGLINLACGDLSYNRLWNGNFWLVFVQHPFTTATVVDTFMPNTEPIRSCSLLSGISDS